MLKKKIYIAGKVSGEPIAGCTMKFGAVQKVLEHRGHTVVNPLALQESMNVKWKDAMQRCIAALITCDAIVMLPDWIDSKGARLEYRIAKSLGLEILILKDVQP